MSFEIDVPRTQLLVTAIVGGVALLAAIASNISVARQLKHQRRLESKKVEQAHVLEVMRILDKPFDLCLSNVIEVEYLRVLDPQLLATPESFQRARPAIIADTRNAYQDFSNAASTSITLLPACRRARGLDLAHDTTYQTFASNLESLIHACADLCARYGNAKYLIEANLEAFEGDPLVRQNRELLASVRHAASVLLASLYS
jgi:hypothetical protein